MQEQIDITSTENGDVSPITKPEPARVPSNNHNSDSIEDKPARDNSDDIGIIDSNCNNYNHPGKPSDFSTNDNSKFVYNLGGNRIDTKDDPMRVDNDDSPASSISNEPCTADAYCSDNRNRDKATFSPFDADTVPPIEFAQATPVPNIRSPHSTDNASAILPGDATQCHRSPQQLQHPLDSDHTQANASDIASTPPSLYFDDNDIDTDTAHSLSSNANSTASHSNSDTTASITITACALSTSRSDLGTDSSLHFSDATDSNSKKDTADNVASFVNIADSTITNIACTFNAADTVTSNSIGNIPCTIRTVTASHNDSDNTTSLITTACAFSASDLNLGASTFSDNADNAGCFISTTCTPNANTTDSNTFSDDSKNNLDNATGIVDTACTLSANPADNNANRKCPDIPNSSCTNPPHISSLLPLTADTFHVKSKASSDIEDTDTIDVNNHNKISNSSIIDDASCGHRNNNVNNNNLAIDNSTVINNNNSSTSNNTIDTTNHLSDTPQATAVTHTVDTTSNSNSNFNDNAASFVNIACILNADRAAPRTARDDEPKHKCLRTPPLDSSSQVPLIAAPLLDKPEEPPPAPRTDPTPSAPNLQAMQDTRPSSLFPLAPFATCPTTCALVSAAQHPVSHHQRTIPATESTIDGLTQEGQFSKHLGGVTTGYVLGLQMPESGHPQPSPDSTDATGQRALLSFRFPCHPPFRSHGQLARL